MIKEFTMAQQGGGFADILGYAHHTGNGLLLDDLSPFSTLKIGGGASPQQNTKIHEESSDHEYHHDLGHIHGEKIAQLTHLHFPHLLQALDEHADHFIGHLQKHFGIRAGSHVGGSWHSFWHGFKRGIKHVARTIKRTVKKVAHTVGKVAKKVGKTALKVAKTALPIVEQLATTLVPAILPEMAPVMAMLNQSGVLDQLNGAIGINVPTGQSQPEEDEIVYDDVYEDGTPVNNSDSQSQSQTASGQVSLKQKPKQKRAKTQKMIDRHEKLRAVMHEFNLTLPKASKYIKENNL